MITINRMNFTLCLIFILGIVPVVKPAQPQRLPAKPRPPAYRLKKVGESEAIVRTTPQVRRAKSSPPAPTRLAPFPSFKQWLSNKYPGGKLRIPIEPWRQGENPDRLMYLTMRKIEESPEYYRKEILAGIRKAKKHNWHSKDSLIQKERNIYMKQWAVYADKQFKLALVQLKKEKALGYPPRPIIEHGYEYYQRPLITPDEAAAKAVARKGISERMKEAEQKIITRTTEEPIVGQSYVRPPAPTRPAPRK